MNPKLKTSITHQVTRSLKPFVFFYVLSYIIILFTTSTKESFFPLGYSDLGIYPLIILTSGGIRIFTDDFKFYIQNGMTRKIIFKSFISAFVIVSFFIALVETILTYILYTNFVYRSLFRSIYGNTHNFAISFFWMFGFFFICLLLIYLSTTIKNIVDKKTSIIILIGIATVILILIPTGNIVTDGAVFQGIRSFFSLLLGFMDGKINFIFPLGTMGILAIIIMISSYLLTKRIEL